jgi:hypothetical protein
MACRTPKGDGMKAILPAVAAVLAAIVLITPSALASDVQQCRGGPEPPHLALLTIKAIHMFKQPIRTHCADLAKGPIWDEGYATRPGQGLTMVIDAHDVTPVPGYGAHGPFYHLNRIRPGDLARIRWNGVWRTYRFVTYPYAKPQREKNKPIKNWRGEVVYFRCCWPRYTRYDWLYERAVLVEP